MGYKGMTGGFAVAVTALTLGISGCQSPTVGAPAPAAAPQNTAVSPGNEESAQAGTPGAAVAAWVTQILEEKYVEACKASVAVADPATSCTGESRATRSLKQLHEAWAKPGVTLPPKAKVEVGKVDAKGDSVTVPDTAVTVDGRTLRDLELIGATGNTSTFKLDLKVQKKDAIWYVSDMKLSF